MQQATVPRPRALPPVVCLSGVGTGPRISVERRWVSVLVYKPESSQSPSSLPVIQYKIHFYLFC